VLAAAIDIAGLPNVVVLSAGTDGSDDRRTRRAPSRTAARWGATRVRPSSWRATTRIVTLRDWAT